MVTSAADSLTQKKALAIEWRAPGSIAPYAKNPRKMPVKAVDAVARSIREFGWRQPIVVDGEGVIVVGHTRLAAALKMGLAEVPVHVADLTPAQARAYRVADNQTGFLTAWDDGLLTEELLALRDEGVDLEVLAFEDGEIERVLGEVDVQPVPSDEQSEIDRRMVTCPECGHEFHAGYGET